MANNLVVQLLLKTGTFSNDLKTAKGQVQSFQRGCQTAGNAVTSFTSALGINVGTLSKYGLAAGAAAAAGKVLKDSFKANTDAMDAFNREMEVVKSTYRSFTSQLFKNGSMTFDFKGIGEQAREYYDAMDNFKVTSVAITNELKLQEIEYNRLYSTAMDVSLSEVDRLEALNEAKKVMQDQLKLKRQMAQFEKIYAKESLENALVSGGMNKHWLETSGQSVLRELLQFNPNTGNYGFDDYYKSVNPSNARTGVVGGHSGVYDAKVKQMETFAGAKAVEAEAKAKGYKDVNEYLQALKAEQGKATETINDTKYQLAQALHNLRGSNEGFEQISKYILLYLNDMGLKQIEAEQKNSDAMIARLRKRITGKDGKTVNYKEGSIGKVEEDLNRLNQKLKEAVTQEARDTILAEIDAVQKTLDIMRGKDNGKDLTQGSIEWLEEKVTNLKNELNGLDLGLADTGSLMQKMNDWEGTWEQFVDNLSDEERELFNKFAEAFKKRWDILNTLEGYQATLGSAQGNKTPEKPQKPVYLEGSYMKRKEDLNARIDQVRKALTEGVNLSTDDIKAKVAELKALEMEVAALEEQFGFKTTIKQTTNTWDEFNSAMANTSTIVNSLTNTFKEGSEITAASILQMVSTALPALGSLISSIQALSAAEAVEAGVAAAGKAVSTSKHWIEAIAAVAALGGVVAAAIASAKSNAQKFANGGIVGGSSFTGDRISANVNSGEMILNKNQQARLFQLANGGGTTGKEVTFHISGTDLVGVLNNQTRKNRLIR